MKASVFILIFIAMLSSCAMKNNRIAIQDAPNFDLSGEWQLSFSLFFGSGYGSKHAEGTLIVTGTDGHYSGVYVTDTTFENDKYRKIVVTQDMSVQYTEKGTVLLKGSNLRFSEVDKWSSFKPDNFELFYAGDNNQLKLSFIDDHGNRGRGTIKRKL